MNAIDADTVYMGRNELYKSTDGGLKWQAVGGFQELFGIFDIQFLDARVGFLVRDLGVYRTNDYGQSWKNVLSGNYVKSVQFTSLKVGYASGGISYDGGSFGYFYRTRDGGNTWKQTLYPFTEIRAFDFIDDNNGFLITYDGSVYKSSNGGENWHKQSQLPDNEVAMDCDFLNASSGYVCTYQGSIFKTSDGGKTWQIDYRGRTTLAALGRSGDNLFAVGNGGLILRKDFISDLTVSNTQIHKQDGQTYISSNIENIGSAGSPETLLAYFWSSDNYYSSDDKLVLTEKIPSIPAGQGGVVKSNISNIQAVRNGFIISYIDPRDQVKETDDKNNTYALAISKEAGATTIYPNPATDKLYFSNEGSLGKVRILHSSGSLVYESSSFSPVDLQRFEKGVYFVNVITNFSNETIRLVVK